MNDESRIPPGQTFRLLSGHILNSLHPMLPPARGCVACGRAWGAHDDPDAEKHAWTCERCGAWLDSGCYRAHTVDAAELVRWLDEDDDAEGLIFLCSACRS